MPPTNASRTSELLEEIISTPNATGVLTIGQVTKMLGGRAFALVILLFALPNSIPIPGIPGFSTITGLPITFIALQMVLGRSSIWLPGKLAYKQFSQEGLAKYIRKAMPYIVKLERYLCPRWGVVCSPLAERLIGLLFVVLSLIIALPIPGGNFLPGLAMSLIALGLLERDGLFVSCACGFAVVSIVLMYQFIILAVKTALSWVGF